MSQAQNIAHIKTIFPDLDEYVTPVASSLTVLSETITSVLSANRNNVERAVNYLLGIEDGSLLVFRLILITVRRRRRWGFWWRRLRGWKFWWWKLRPRSLPTTRSIESTFLISNFNSRSNQNQPMSSTKLQKLL